MIGFYLGYFLTLALLAIYWYNAVGLHIEVLNLAAVI